MSSSYVPKGLSDNRPQLVQVTVSERRQIIAWINGLTKVYGANMASRYRSGLRSMLGRLDFKYSHPKTKSK